MVHFVGAGSGAADLITVRGARLLAEADVIIYAGSLVNPELLSYAKPGCEIHNSATMTLEEVIAVMRDAEAAGKTTVRLHTGDSSIYGAVREQFDELEKLQISYDLFDHVDLCQLLFVRAVGKIEAGNVDARLAHGGKNSRVTAGRTDGSDNFCFSHKSVPSSSVQMR